MPELPEVETTLCGIKPHMLNQQIVNVTVRHYGLRWPIPAGINHTLMNQTIQQIQRRGKYLLFKLKNGTLIMHLGMSGSLRILKTELAYEKHDHFELILSNSMRLRFNDPRRFGAILWTSTDPDQHALLKNLGPEPLTRGFTGTYLWQQAKSRSIAIKSFIMNHHIVVGVGNIYATEALFLAGIHPEKPAKQLTIDDFSRLTKIIKTILKKAIKQGGTTIKNFVDSSGKPGYFALQLKAYGRGGSMCLSCKKTVLEEMRLGQRSTVFCPNCQT